MKKNLIELLPADLDLCKAADHILSIVPPRDALLSAQRIASVLSTPDFAKRPNPLFYLDLNAISPHTARDIDEIFNTGSLNIKYVGRAVSCSCHYVHGRSNFKTD